MKTKLLIFLLASGFLALAAWLVHVPDRAEADDVPEKYRNTVQKGLEFLAKNQHKDGHWNGDGGKHPVAMTGLVGLALLMERENPRTGEFRVQVAVKAKYPDQINNAVDWLIDKSQTKRDGLIFSEHPSETTRYMQGHGLATLFLAGACQGEQDDVRRKKLIDVLVRAVKYIGKAQSSQGGWYDTSKVEGHDLATIAATAIQIQALQAAENAGIPVPNAAINDCQEYLKMALTKEEKAKPGQTGKRATDTAAALACRGNVVPFARGNGNKEQEELREKWFKFCQAEIPIGRDSKFGRDEFAHYYYAQAVFNSTEAGNKSAIEAWNAYRAAMFDHLQSSQNKDGSWPAAEVLGVGQVYATAVWCIVLQLDKRSHPSRQPVKDRVIFWFIRVSCG